MRTLVFIAVIGLAIFGLTRVIPGGFLPQEDQGYLMIGINLPNAASLERTEKAVTEIQHIVSRLPEVRYTAGVSGFNLLSGVASSNSGVLFVTLVDYSQRKTTAMQLVDQLNGELYVMVNDAQAFAFQSPSIPGLGTTAGVSLMVQDRGGNGIPYLSQHTDEFLEKAKQLPEISSITSQFDAGVPQRKVVIDQNQAFQQGVSMDEIHNVLST